MRVTYLFDPLCGWCYGASASLAQLLEIEGVDVEMRPTGLFAGEGARRMDRHFAEFAWQNDQRIARLTNQPFSDAYRTQVLGAEGAMFDSAPATLAIVAVGMESTAEQEFAALKALQAARYEQGRNTGDLLTVVAVLKEAGFHEAASRLEARDEALFDQYRARISKAQADMAQFGVRGVPALVIGEGPDRRLVRADALFGNLDLLKAQLAA